MRPRIVVVNEQIVVNEQKGAEEDVEKSAEEKDA
jgi:hypothetical protein